MEKEQDTYKTELKPENHEFKKRAMVSLLT